MADKKGNCGCGCIGKKQGRPKASSDKIGKKQGRPKASSDKKKPKKSK